MYFHRIISVGHLRPLHECVWSGSLRRLFETDFIWICFSVNSTETLHDWVWTLTKKGGRGTNHGGKKRKRNRQTEKHITCAAWTTAALSHTGNRVGAGSVASPFTWTVPHSDSGFARFLFNTLTHKDQTSENHLTGWQICQNIPRTEKKKKHQIWFKSFDMMFFLTPKVDFIVCLVC